MENTVLENLIKQTLDATEMATAKSIDSLEIATATLNHLIEKSERGDQVAWSEELSVVSGRLGRTMRMLRATLSY